MMDIEEFKKLEKPGAKRSKLDPFMPGIFELKNAGYTDEQIKRWLELNGVNVSRESVRAFIKRRARADADKAAKREITKPLAMVARTDQSPEEPARKITNPADIRKSKKREFNLDDYSTESED